MDTSDKNSPFLNLAIVDLFIFKKIKILKNLARGRPLAGKMIEAGLEKLVEKFVREFTKDVCSLVSQNERMVFKPC